MFTIDFYREVVDWTRFVFYDADTDIAALRYVDEHASTGEKQIQCLCVPFATASADKSIFAAIIPIGVIGFTERDVEILLVQGSWPFNTAALIVFSSAA